MECSGTKSLPVPERELTVCKATDCSTVSVALALHAAIGNVGAGSLFAYLQSAAMGGYGVVLRLAITRINAALVGGVARLIRTARHEGKKRE